MISILYPAKESVINGFSSAHIRQGCLSTYYFQLCNLLLHFLLFIFLLISFICFLAAVRNRCSAFFFFNKKAIQYCWGLVYWRITTPLHKRQAFRIKQNFLFWERGGGVIQVIEKHHNIFFLPNFFTLRIYPLKTIN